MSEIIPRMRRAGERAQSDQIPSTPADLPLHMLPDVSTIQLLLPPASRSEFESALQQSPVAERSAVVKKWGMFTLEIHNPYPHYVGESVTASAAK